MPLIPNSGIFKNYLQSYFMAVLAKCLQTQIEAVIGKCLQIKIDAVKLKFKIWNLSQNLESQSNSRITIQIHRLQN
jgi:hypothetical protein